MLVFAYKSKKELKESIGERLNYIETSMFGDEYRSTGSLVRAHSHHSTNMSREFFDQVTMENDVIVKVS